MNETGLSDFIGGGLGNRSQTGVLRNYLLVLILLWDYPIIHQNPIQDSI